jgi:leader peptidase (prepilin peptidase)/N-methyltransferase
MAYIGTAILLTAAAGAGDRWGSMLVAMLSGIVLAAFYLALAAVLPGGIGLGDVKLAASLGTLLGWFGWPAVVRGTFAAFLLAAVYGAGLVVTRRARPGTSIPFGPFMAADALTAILAGVI